MAQRTSWTPLEDAARREHERTRDEAAPGGPADVAAGWRQGHWEAPRDYGAQAHAAGQHGARNARPSGPARSAPAGADPFAPARYRYDMTVPPVGLRDREQLVGGHGFSGLAREIGTAPRGPKGYRRSDERVREDICEALMAATHLDASDVSVDVKEGVVILEGIVPERRMKHAIEDITADCRGVLDVENRIRVVRGGADPLLER